MKRFTGRWKKERGQLLVELAIVLPVFVMLGLGAIQILRLGVRQIQLNYGTFLAARTAVVTAGRPDAVAATLREVSSRLDPDRDDVDATVRTYTDPNTGATYVAVIVRTAERGLFPLPNGETQLGSRMDLLMGTASIASMKPYYTSNARYPRGPQLLWDRTYRGVGTQINATSGYDQVLKGFVAHEARFESNGENGWPTGLKIWYPEVRGFQERGPRNFSVIDKVYGNTEYMIRGATAVLNDILDDIPFLGRLLSWLMDALWDAYSLQTMNSGEHWSRQYTALMHGQWSAWYYKRECFGFGGGGCSCGKFDPCFEGSVGGLIPLSFDVPGSAGWQNFGALKPDFGFVVWLMPPGIHLRFELGAAGVRGYGDGGGQEWAFVNGTWANASWPEYWFTFVGGISLVLSSIPVAGAFFQAVYRVICFSPPYEAWFICGRPEG